MINKCGRLTIYMHTQTNTQVQAHKPKSQQTHLTHMGTIGNMVTHKHVHTDTCITRERKQTQAKEFEGKQQARNRWTNLQAIESSIALDGRSACHALGRRGSNGLRHGCEAGLNGRGAIVIYDPVLAIAVHKSYGRNLKQGWGYGQAVRTVRNQNHVLVVGRG